MKHSILCVVGFICLQLLLVQAFNNTELDRPTTSQLENEEILLTLDDIFSGTTTIDLLPDMPEISELVSGNYSDEDTDDFERQQEDEDQYDEIDDKKECLECVKYAAEKVLQHVIDHIKDVCAKTKCPHLKKHCEWMEKHPKFTLGSLIYHVRPHSLGFSYCIGAKKCKHHDKEAFFNESLSQSDALAVESILEYSERNRNFSEALDSDLTIDDVIELRNNIIELQTSAIELPNDESCERCVHWVAFLVMKHHVENFIHLCHDTKCPVIKAHCKWAAHNFAVWLGMNTAAVRPHEFSYGFCVGHTVCDPKHHHKHFDASSQPANATETDLDPLTSP
jgi:hypothetical protein